MLWECSHGSLVWWFHVNWKSLGNILQEGTYWCVQQGLLICWFWWENIRHSKGNSWCAQWNIMGAYIIMHVNNIPTIRPAVICMPFNSNFPIWCVISAWKIGMNWGVCTLLDTCNRTCFFCSPMETHVMVLGIEKLKLSAVKWGFYENM